MTDEFKKWLASASVRCILAEVKVKVGGVETTRYLSSSHFTSKPTDTPANTPYAANGDGSLSFGSLDIDNSDCAVDSWLNDLWAMREIKIYVGAPYWPRSMFQAVFTGTVEDISPRARNILTLKIRDVLAVLNSPVTTAVIGGTGDNKDTILPITLGEVFNIEPTLINEFGDPVYQVNQGAIESIIEVRDNGYPVSATFDVANGKFTLTNARYGTITCDVQGAHIGGAYKNDVGSLVEALATTLGDGEKVSSSLFDSAAMTAFKTANPQPVGYFIPDRVNRLQAMQELAASVGAAVTCSMSGLVKLAKLEFGTPSRTISSKDMEDGSFSPTSKSSVLGAVQLAGCKNWTPQDAAGLAAALPTASIPLLTEEFVVVKQEDALVLADYKQSAPAQIDTFLIVESDLVSEALRRLNLWKVPRYTYRFTCFAENFDVELGDTITLKYPRFGLDTGVSAIVMGLETNFMTGRISIEVLV